MTHSAEDAFDVIGINVYDNHPRWEPEALACRLLNSRGRAHGRPGWSTGLRRRIV